MNTKISQLIDLQKLDLKIYDIREQQQNIPRGLEAAHSPLLECQKKLDEIAKALNLIGTERRSSEQDLSAHESHIQKLRSRLTDLKTNKEYQAHLFEIELANKKRDSLEEKVLLVLEQGEEKQKELKEVESRKAEAEKAYEEEKAELESLRQRLSAELAELEQQQKDLVPQLDQSLWNRYSSLRSKLSSLVVVPVRAGTCLGCQLQLPPQLFAEVKRGDKVLMCDYCHRILYWEPPLDDSKELLPSDEPCTSGPVHSANP